MTDKNSFISAEQWFAVSKASSRARMYGAKGLHAIDRLVTAARQASSLKEALLDIEGALEVALLVGDVSEKLRTTATIQKGSRCEACIEVVSLLSGVYHALTLQRQEKYYATLGRAGRHA